MQNYTCCPAIPLLASTVIRDSWAMTRFQRRRVSCMGNVRCLRCMRKRTILELEIYFRVALPISQPSKSVVSTSHNCVITKIGSGPSSLRGSEKRRASSFPHVPGDRPGPSNPTTAIDSGKLYKYAPATIQMQGYGEDHDQRSNCILALMEIQCSRYFNSSILTTRQVSLNKISDREHLLKP